MNTELLSSATQASVISPEAFLDHWQGHRRLTRKVIEHFPEDKLFDYSLGGMRPFSELAMEMITIAGPGINGIANRLWEAPRVLSHHTDAAPRTREALLNLWDEVTVYINATWGHIPHERFQEIDLAFGKWQGPVHWILFYFIDNEIHHRGQGYVYLRSLGIAPPPFWERS